jgi:hypothetical protein
MAQTWRETTTTTPMTSQIVQMVFVSLERRSFRQKLWSGGHMQMLRIKATNSLV